MVSKGQAMNFEFPSAPDEPVGVAVLPSHLPVRPPCLDYDPPDYEIRPCRACGMWCAEIAFDPAGRQIVREWHEPACPVLLEATNVVAPTQPATLRVVASVIPLVTAVSNDLVGLDFSVSDVFRSCRHCPEWYCELIERPTGETVIREWHRPDCPVAVEWDDSQASWPIGGV